MPDKAATKRRFLDFVQASKLRLTAQREAIIRDFQEEQRQESLNKSPEKPSLPPIKK